MRPKNHGGKQTQLRRKQNQDPFLIGAHPAPNGMYIGRIGDGSHYDDGAYILLKEVIDNAIDEYIMGFGREVRIDIEDNQVRVRDFGRGSP